MAEVSISERRGTLIHDLPATHRRHQLHVEYGLHFFDRRAHHNAGWPPTPGPRRRLAAIEGWSDAADDDAFRTQVRTFISEHGYRLPRGRARTSGSRAGARIRGWLRALYDAGYLGAGWPPEWGGRPGHEPLHDLIVMEELILGDATGRWIR